MSTFQSLEETFGRLASDFSKVSQHLDKYEKTLDAQMENFHNVANTPLIVKIKKDIPLMAVFEDLQKECRKDCDTWLQATEFQRKNTNFRNRHSDSLMIYVYGKVKSGKSSLGNFVAYGKHDPSAEDISRFPQVDFDIEAGAASSVEVDENTLNKVQRQREGTRNSRKFLVDFLEATACIQYFTKPGLTWVDSPGIHSTTAINGDLAREYLASADLVLYTTRARNAFQDADREELVSIVNSGKPYVLLITRSDANEKDVDEEGNTISILHMLSSDDQRKIRTWGVSSLLDTLKDNNIFCSPELLEENILVISSLYAEKNPDNAGWEASGMAAFCQKIQNIAQSEGIKIKRETPLKNVVTQIERIKNGGKDLTARIEVVRILLEGQRTKINRTCEQKKLECSTELQSKIIPLAKKYYGQDELFSKTALEVASQIVIKVQESFSKIIVNDIGSMLKDLPFGMDSPSFKKFEDIVQTIQFRSKRKSILGAIFGSVGGAIAGFIVGGPAGAGVGASLGAGAGKTVGGNFDDHGTSSMVIGNNSQDVGRDAVTNLQQNANKILDETCKVILDDCVVPLEQWLYRLEKQLNVYMTFLSETKNNINKELGQ